MHRSKNGRKITRLLWNNFSFNCVPLLMTHFPMMKVGCSRSRIMGRMRRNRWALVVFCPLSFVLFVLDLLVVERFGLWARKLEILKLLFCLAIKLKVGEKVKVILFVGCIIVFVVCSLSDEFFFFLCIIEDLAFFSFRRYLVIGNSLNIQSYLLSNIFWLTV